MTRIPVEEWIDEDGLTRIMGMTREGLTNEEVASRIGIGTRTLYSWMSAHPEIAEAIKKGREPADIRVEDSLYKRALGYYYTETMVTEMPDGSVIKRTTTKHMPGNVAAMIYWLKNRKPSVWRDRRDDIPNDGDGMECGVIILPARTAGEEQAM